MPKELPSPETLRKLLRYDPETGKLFWRHRNVEFFKDGKYSASRACLVWNARHEGAEALTAVKDGGYLHGNIFRQRHRAHRVIWAMQVGEWPHLEIDHINGNPSDNRMENLRLATGAENSRNQKMLASNTSGHKNVSYIKRKGKWLARLNIGGGKIWQREFADKQDAAQAAAEARVRFHGEFARHQ